MSNIFKRINFSGGSGGSGDSLWEQDIVSALAVTAPQGGDANQGDFFIVSDGVNDFAVWLNIDGDDTPPSGPIFTAVGSKGKCDILSSDSAAQIVVKIRGNVTLSGGAFDGTVVDSLLSVNVNDANQMLASGLSATLISVYNADEDGPGSFTSDGSVQISNYLTPIDPEASVPADVVYVTGTYSSIPSAPTDLETAISELNSAIVGEGVWDRSGSTIVPHTANDNLDMGSGALKGGSEVLTTGVHTSSVANGASAIAHTLDSSNTMSTSGAKLLSVKNNGSEKFAVDKDGNVTASGSFPAGSGISSTGDSDNFIDSDNTSSTNAWNLYHDVSSPSGTTLVKLVEDARHGFGTNTPFVTSLATLPSNFVGLHVRGDDSNNERPTLVLEAGNASGRYPQLLLIGGGLGFAIKNRGSQGNKGVLFTKETFGPETDNAKLHFQMDNLGALAIGMEFNTGVTDGCWINTPQGGEFLVFSQNVSGTNYPYARIAGTGTAPGSQRTISWDIVATDGSGNQNGFMLRSGAPSNGCQALFGDISGTAVMEFDRSGAGTNMIQMLGTHTDPASGNTLKAYRNLASGSTDSPVVSFVNDHASDDQDLLSLQQDGSGDVIDAGVFRVAADGTVFHNSSEITKLVITSGKELDDALATDTLAEHVFFQAPSACTVLAAYYLPDSALTADDTNYATITVSRRSTSGGSKSQVAQQTTKITGGSGNWTAFDGVSLGSITNAALAAGEVLTWEYAKTLAGVIIPAGTLIVEYRVG